jgi:hypothetical protein
MTKSERRLHAELKKLLRKAPPSFRKEWEQVDLVETDPSDFSARLLDTFIVALDTKR